MPEEENNRTQPESRKTTRAGPTTGTITRPTTRNESRRTGNQLANIEEEAAIRTASEARKYLEQRQLLWPPAEPITNASLAACLHQISAISGIPKTASSAISSVALLVEEMEDTGISIIIRDAVNTQLSELTTDMRLLINDAKEQIDIHVKEKIEELGNNAIANTPSTPVITTNKLYSYAEALIKPPPHANPKLAAREGIRARQFMFDGLDADIKYGGLNNIQLKKELNNLLIELGATKTKIRSASNQKHKGILVEMETDESANWMNNLTNRKRFCSALGDNTAFKPRTYNLIAYNAPLTLEPKDPKHRDEFCEANNLEKEELLDMRWAKPIERRTLTQKSAHLIVSLTEPLSANRAISNGLSICNKRVFADKLKKEPIRCLKCQGWNHFANECIATKDKCGNCTGDHKTNKCPQPNNHRCVSCDKDGHASWSRTCPTFQKKKEDFNNRNPDNTLQFFPTNESWTWTSKPKEHQQSETGNPSQRTIQNAVASQSQTHNGKNPHTTKHKPRRWDTYVPFDWSNEPIDLIAQYYPNPTTPNQLDSATANPLTNNGNN
jgi:hypothetical protein